MRIGIDLTSIWRPATGAEVVALGLTEELLRLDVQNEYVLFFSRAIHHNFEKFAGRYKAVLVPLSHELLVKHLCLSRSVASVSLDYMHFPAFPPPWRLACPMGWTVPDATPWVHPDTMKPGSRWYYKVFGGRAFRTNRLLITDSQASREDLIRHARVCPEQVHVIYPGIRSIFQRRYPPSELELVRQRYGLPGSFILFVGTLEPRKNLPRVLSAFRTLKTQRNFELDLVIVGRRGWLHAPIFKEMGNDALAGHVHVTGYIPDDDLVALYQMARLFVFPSLYEGFGLPCVEAMLCGCPVVTSNRGALLEVTTNSAVHCDPEDVTSIAETIWRAHTDGTLRDKLIASGLRRAAMFSWSSYARRFLDILGPVIEKGESGRAGQLHPVCPA